VNMFLDFAEDRASRREEITLAQWIEQTEIFLSFNEREILEDSGSKSRQQMLEHTQNEYATFEKNRLEALKEQAEDEHLKELESTLKKSKKK